MLGLSDSDDLSAKFASQYLAPQLYCSNCNGSSNSSILYPQLIGVINQTARWSQGTDLTLTLAAQMCSLLQSDDEFEYRKSIFCINDI